MILMEIQKEESLRNLEGVRELFKSDKDYQNKMAVIKTTVKVPEFDRENIHMYIDELTMWALITEVEKKKQGQLVFQRTIQAI